MRENSIKYGWIMQFFESPIIAADSLWEATNKYIKDKKIRNPYISQLTSFFGDYHRCHYWNNFEILDLNFFRSAQYL